MGRIETLHTLTDWEKATHKIPEQGLLVFKFSPRCPISLRVERDVDAWYEQSLQALHCRCVKVDVVNARALSRHIAQELSVPHESPQAILLSSTLNVHWHDSHLSIKGSVLDAQLASLSV
ncbi:hypothetical protein CSB45_04985 [candidate division KSB3 bacterium]|uniref:Bacillithiol system redox-active protein YtxJ n=1 Tax=candidate division KSB3 bacterium TaxID=2044937 RepID=A0A2G6E802_9BACT|nr:MAG: hypothetical protein CSB45_04985 [candidate division KSB3 bacterium]PIE30410.1 MAG: hypothetical protein CSA57_03750 [candidate division KSB3 bacterium]